MPLFFVGLCLRGSAWIVPRHRSCNAAYPSPVGTYIFLVCSDLQKLQLLLCMGHVETASWRTRLGFRWFDIHMYKPCAGDGDVKKESLAVFYLH